MAAMLGLRRGRAASADGRPVGTRHPSSHAGPCYDGAMPPGTPVSTRSPPSRSSAGLDADALERLAASDALAPLPARRGHLPHRRPGRRPVRHRQRRGQDLAAVRDRGRGHPGHAPRRATCSASSPCSTARRARPARPRSAPTETVVLPRDRFRELIATEAGVRDALLASIAGELRRLTTHVEELHFLDITGRLAARLVRLAQEGGTPPADGAIRLRTNLTQGDLAAMVGCTRQSVNKLLGQFTDDGLLRLERDAIVVTDLEGLAATARR